MPPVGFEPTISAGERPQTYALDRAATGTGRPRNESDFITLPFEILLKICWSFRFELLSHDISCNSYTILLSLPSSTKVKNVWSHTSTHSILPRGVQRNTSYFISFPYYYSNRDSSVGTVFGQRTRKTENFVSIPSRDTRFFCYLNRPQRLWGPVYI